MNIRIRSLSIVIFCFLILFALYPNDLYAQFTVSGTIIDDETNTPIYGANIIDKQSQNGTFSDREGKFVLYIPSSSTELTISFIGYVDYTVEVSREMDIMVRLKRDISRLDELVVTGLASTVKRSNLGHAVEKVSNEELTGISQTQTLSSNLYGKISGATINANSGAPGGGFSILLRGVTTINGASQPLYIVDGVYYDNTATQNGAYVVTKSTGGGNTSIQDDPVNRIADLNAADIASIEILKGPSASAIYGQRAAGGVVIITTKRGSSGVSQLNFSQSFGITTIQRKLGSRTFSEEIIRSKYLNDKGKIDEESRETYEADLALYRDAEANNRFLDYEELLYGEEGMLLRSNLSAAFGNNNSQFFISGTWQDDEGIIKTTGYEKQSIRLNIDHRFSSRFKMALSSGYNRSQSDRGLANNDNSGTTFGVAMTATPNYIDLRKDELGNYPHHSFNSSNQLQTRDLFSNAELVNRTSVSANVSYLLYESSINTINIQFSGGLDYYEQNNRLVFPSLLQFEQASGSPGTLLSTNSTNLNTNVVGSLSHLYSNNDISVSSQVGYTSFNNDYNSIFNVGKGIIGTQTNIDQVVSSTVEQTVLSQRDRGFFVQSEVNYKDQFIVSGGVRVDKSDRNTDVNKLYTYPKFSVAWRLSNMDFWDNALPISNLKLRFAYGQTGNLSTFGAKYTSLNVSNIDGIAGLVVGNNRKGKGDIEPERQSEFEFGLDATFGNNLVGLEVTYYRKNITNMLLNRETESSTGFEIENLNGGELQNSGIEIGLNISPIRQENFSWGSGINFWKNTSKIVSLPVPAFNVGGFGTSLGVFRIEEGKSATQIVGLDPEVDANGNLVLDSEGNANIIAKALGDAEADFQMSWFNEMTIMKNLSISFLIHWKQGGDAINLTELLSDLNGTTTDYDDTGLEFENFRLQAAGLDGTETNGTKRGAFLGVSAMPFVQDATYIRLREVGVYYSLPSQWLDRWNNGWIQQLSIGLSANNLFSYIPNYRSYDPEVSNFGNQPIANGIEVTPYPSSKQYYFHINIGF